MSLRISTTRAVGLAAAALALGAVSASAQRTTSQRRIPVTKESTGEVTSRVDTVTMTRVDTVYQTTSRTDTVFRYDTVTRTTTLPVTFRRIGGLYFGLGAGGNVPRDYIENGQTGSYGGTAMLGYDPMNFPLGIRFDADYNTFNRNDLAWQSAGLTGLGRPTLLTFAGNLKLRIPLNAQRWNNVNLYALGGGTYNRYKNVAIPIGTGTTNTIPATSDWHDAWGWQAGGGLSLGLGGTGSFFVESRYQRWNMDTRVGVNNSGNFQRAAIVPIVAGFTWTL